MSQVQEEQTGVRESDLAARLGVDRTEIRRLRADLAPGQWWKGGPKGNAIFWSIEAAETAFHGEPLNEDCREEMAQADAVAEAFAPDPEPEPKLERLQVVKLPPNQHFVLVNDGGKARPVRVKRGAGKKMLKKMILCRRQPSGMLEHVK